MTTGWERSAPPSGRRFRRRALPSRTVADTVVVARPADGAPVVLPATAATLWHGLAEWISIDEAIALLAQAFPSVDHEELSAAVVEILDRLRAEEVLELG